VLRAEARTHIEETSAAALKKYIERGDDLFKRVKAPAEAVLDSRNLLLVADAASILARSLKINSNAFDTDDFVGKLARLLGGGSNARRMDEEEEEEEEEEDDEDQGAEIDVARWDDIGRIAQKSTFRVPVMDFMSVSLSLFCAQRATWL
jgi:hypothetical protein